MINLKFTRNFLLLLFLIYLAKGSLYPEGTLISKITLIIILIISTFYLLKTLFLTNKKTTFYKAWTALLILNLFGYVFTGDYSNTFHNSMISEIIVASLTFYPFYYFSLRNGLHSKHLLYFFSIVLPLIILQYFANANQILSERISGNTDLVNNVAYTFVALIPSTFLIGKNKKLISFGAMFILMFFIIQGAKRGAIITGTFCLVSFTYYQLRTVSKKYKFRSYLFVFFAILLLSYYAYDLYESNQYLITRMQEVSKGDSSGRDFIYNNIFNSWYNSNSFINLLFGFGFAASLKLSGMQLFAHNDWLELLSNFGILGVLFYLFLFYSAFKALNNKRWNIDKKLMLFTILISWFLITLFSMFYTSSISFLYAIFLAYLFGNKSNYLI